MGRSAGTWVRVVPDIVGKQFGKWTILSPANPSKRQQAKWLCRCVCGTEKIIYEDSLFRGTSKGCQSCGSKIHGESQTKLYKHWENMISRATLSYYEYHAGRGIGVCDAWCKYEVFRDWSILNGYKEGLCLDRFPDTDGDYCPSNCRWATAKMNARNVKRRFQVEYKGQIVGLSELMEKVGCVLNRSTVRNRIESYGWEVEKALFHPSQGKFGRGK